MTEYSISPALRTLGFFFTAVCIFGGIWLIYDGVTYSGSDNAIPILFGGVMLILAGIIIYLGVKRLCVTVDENTLTVQTSFINEEVLLSDIGGYRRGDKGRFYLVRKD